MKSSIAFPFLTLSESAVDASPWKMALGGDEPGFVSGLLSNWDPSIDVRFCRMLRIDRSIAASDLSLRKKDLRLAAIVHAGTGPGRLPRRFVRQKKILIKRTATPVKFVIPGGILAGSIDLSTEIVLAEAPAWPDPLSPARTGDKVWFDRYRVALDAEALRFPMEIADLREILGPESFSSDAPWYLDWLPHDWSRDLHGTLRLYINSRFEEVVDRVCNHEPLTLQAIMADVICQVCEKFVQDKRIHEMDAHWDAGTIGAQAQAWLELAWPGRGQEFVESLLENNPGEFRATILAIANLGESAR